MTTAALLIELRKLVTELKGRIRERRDAELYQKIYSLQQQIEDSQKKEIAEAEKRHTSEIAAHKETIAMLSRERTPSTMKWGGLVFEGDEKLYCPACFHVRGQKIPTSRNGASHRFCSACRANIPSN